MDSFVVLYTSIGVKYPDQGWDMYCPAGKCQWKMPENTGMAALQFVCGVMPIKGLVAEYALPGTGGR